MDGRETVKNAGILSAITLGVIGLAVCLAVINGFMLSYMWQWFVVPLGVRAIGIPQAIGIGAIVSMLTSEATPNKDADPSESLNNMLGRALGKIAAFGIAFGLSFMVPA